MPKFDIPANETTNGIKVLGVPTDQTSAINWLVPTFNYGTDSSGDPVKASFSDSGEQKIAADADKIADLKTLLDDFNAEDFATQATLSAVKTVLDSIDGKDFATESTLTALKNLIDNVDFATQTTLASLEGKDFATESTLSALKSAFDSQDFATQSTLSSLEGKDFATESTLSSLEGKDFATETSISDLLTKIGAIADSAVTDETADASTIALLKGIVSLLSTLDSKDFATESTLSSLNGTDFATQSTLDALNTAFGDTDFATEATLSSLEGKDFAKETSLTDLVSALGSMSDSSVSDSSSDASSIALLKGLVSILNSLEGKDFATESTLSALKTAFDDEDFATETTLASLEGKDFATQSTLSSIDTLLDNIFNSTRNTISVDTRGSNEKVADFKITFPNDTSQDSTQTNTIDLTSSISEDLQKDNKYEIFIHNPSTVTNLSFNAEVKWTDADSNTRYAKLLDTDITIDKESGCAEIIEGIMMGDGCRITLSNGTSLGSSDTFDAYVQIRKI